MRRHNHERIQQAHPTRQQRKAARMLASGASFTDALTIAGYSPAQARKGMAKILKSSGLREALLQEMEKFPPEVRAALVRRRLVQNVIDGEDHAVRSARLLGQDREVDMFARAQSDGQRPLVIMAPDGKWFEEAIEHARTTKELPPPDPPGKDDFPDYD
jgi:hypothetical protein